MPIKLRAADGSIQTFPDGTSPDAIKLAMTAYANREDWGGLQGRVRAAVGQRARRGVNADSLEAPSPPSMGGPAPPSSRSDLTATPIDLRGAQDDRVPAYGRAANRGGGDPVRSGRGQEPLHVSDSYGTVVRGDPGDPNNPITVTAPPARRSNSLQDALLREIQLFYDMAGKARAAPYTAVGAVGALAAGGVGRALGHGSSFHFGDDALQLLNTPWIDRAFTLGNVQFYPESGGPDEERKSYTGAMMRTGAHEAGHSRGFEAAGLNYGPLWVLGGGGVRTNPLEISADAYGLGKSSNGLPKGWR